MKKSIWQRMAEVDRKMSMAVHLDDIDDCGGDCSLMKNVECKEVDRQESRWAYMYKMKDGVIGRHLAAKEMKRIYVISGMIILEIYTLAESRIVELSAGTIFEIPPSTPHSIKGTGTILASYESI